MKRSFIFSLFVAIALTSCSNDDSMTGPTPFRVDITVTDPSGAPVEGLEFGVAPHLPEYYQDQMDTPIGFPDDALGLPHPSPFYPVTALQYTVAEEAVVHFFVEDIEGTKIQMISEGPSPAGQYTARWDGKDDSGAPQSAGIYYVHLVLEVGQETRYDDRRPMLLAPFYPDQYLVGTTNAYGQLRITDERLFPHLYGVTDVPLVDESGTQVGLMTIGPTMRFYVVDPATGDTMSFDRDVTGSGELEMVWDPLPKPARP